MENTLLLFKHNSLKRLKSQFLLCGKGLRGLKSFLKRSQKYSKVSFEGKKHLHFRFSTSENEGVQAGFVDDGEHLCATPLAGMTVG